MKFINSITNKEDRTSVTWIKYKNMIYAGVAHCHPDDEWSEFTGCRIAEVRAEISALKDEYKEAKAKCEECRKFVRAVEQYATFNPEDPTAKVMYRQLNRRIAAVNKIATKINAKELELKASIRLQTNIENKAKKKKNSKNN